MQLAAQFADRLFDESGLGALVHAFNDDIARRFDGEIGDLAAHFGDGLRFGAGDFVLGGLGAALDLGVDLFAALRRQALGVAPRLLDDAFGFVFGFALAALIWSSSSAIVCARLSRPPAIIL
jgi:hypothetical protein